MLKLSDCDLVKHMDYRGTPLEELLTEGRLLESSKIDPTGGEDHLLYRKVLKSYDRSRGEVILSKVGSLSRLANLDIPEKPFTSETLYHDAEKMYWVVREKGYRLS
jgi:hypothetical protein